MAGLGHCGQGGPLAGPPDAGPSLPFLGTWQWADLGSRVPPPRDPGPGSLNCNSTRLLRLIFMPNLDFYFRSLVMGAGCRAFSVPLVLRIQIEDSRTRTRLSGKQRKLAAACCASEAMEARLSTTTQRRELLFRLPTAAASRIVGLPLPALPSRRGSTANSPARDSGWGAKPVKSPPRARTRSIGTHRGLGPARASSSLCGRVGRAGGRGLTSTDQMAAMREGWRCCETGLTVAWVLGGVGYCVTGAARTRNGTRLAAACIPHHGCTEKM